MTSNYLTTPNGYELPFSSTMTSTTVILVSGGSSGARVTTIRVAEVGAVSSTTLRLDVLAANGTSTAQIRGAKALAVHEVYQDYDVRLLQNETLRAVANVSGGAHITGLYITRAPGT